MTQSEAETSSPSSKKRLAKRWIFIGLLVFVLLVSFGVWASTSNRMARANGDKTLLLVNLLSKPSLTPSVTTAPIKTATATLTPTATTTSTSTLTPTPLPTLTATSTPEVKAQTLFDDVVLYSGPGEDFTVIRQVTRSETLTVMSQFPNKRWLHVKTAEGQEGWLYKSLTNLDGLSLDGLAYETPVPTKIPTPVALEGIEGHWIDIDLGDQMVYAFDGTTLMGSFLVSTGTSAFPTETGQYHIYAKFLFSTMDGGDFFLPDVPWTMFYNRDFSIHGTYWHHNFGTPMSHGCINMSIADAKFLYDFSEIGTFVNIHY